MYFLRNWIIFIIVSERKKKNILCARLHTYFTVCPCQKKKKNAQVTAMVLSAYCTNIYDVYRIHTVHTTHVAKYIVFPYSSNNFILTTSLPSPPFSDGRCPHLGVPPGHVRNVVCVYFLCCKIPLLAFDNPPIFLFFFFLPKTL